MIRLFTTYYKEVPERQAEIDFCLQKNIDNPMIDEIYLLVEKDTNDEYFIPIGFEGVSKLIIIKSIGRPFFYSVIRHINYTFSALHDTGKEVDGITIIANSDIYFDDTIWNAYKIKKDQCFALTRWDVDSRDDNWLSYHYAAGNGSQDAWIFKGPIKVFFNVSFYFGKLGCDNRFAYECARAGYDLLNPSLTIKAHHLHRSNVRHYSEEKVPGPYCLIDPCSL